jgi:hypothetical protein
MALSQGKDARGNYKPSLWLTVKGFASKEGDETVPQALGALSKGVALRSNARRHITGRLAYEVSTSNGKGYVNLVAFKVEHPQPVQAQTAEEDCPY